MKTINFATVVQRIKKSFWLLFSTIAALCLFLSPSLSALLLTAAIFAAVVAAVVVDVAKPTAMHMRNTRIASILLAVLIAYLGFDTFHTTWALSSKVAALAGALGLTTPVLLLIVGAVGCIVGFYAIYVFSYWIVSWSAKLIKERLPVQQKAEIIANLKRNWYFLISAMAFFCLTMDNTLGYCIGLLIVFAIMVIAASQIPSTWGLVKENTVVDCILCLSCAAGICLGNQAHFYEETLKLIQRMGLPEMFDKLFLLASYFGAVCALFFVFFCVLIFWKKAKQIASGLGLTDGVSWKEWTIYALLLVISLSFMVFSFSQSQAFYGTDYSYDIIYTSDSPALVKGNVYLALTHSENDLRQPLFAVFAAPFTGIPYLLARLVGASASVQAMLVNSAQILMLFAANLMLAKMMKLDAVKRICIMVLTSCTHTQLLFTLMMEQYIVAYFWLILCM